MGHRTYDEVVASFTPERRARIESLTNEALAEVVAYTLGELRRHRDLTQAELAHRLDCSQASISGMENAADNLVSTLRAVVEAMGGRLDIAAVFGHERIPLTTHPKHDDASVSRPPSATLSR